MAGGAGGAQGGGAKECTSASRSTSASVAASVPAAAAKAQRLGAVIGLEQQLRQGGANSAVTEGLLLAAEGLLGAVVNSQSGVRIGGVGGGGGLKMKEEGDIAGMLALLVHKYLLY